MILKRTFEDYMTKKIKKIAFFMARSRSFIHGRIFFFFVIVILFTIFAD